MFSNQVFLRSKKLRESEIVMKSIEANEIDSSCTYQKILQKVGNEILLEFQLKLNKLCDSRVKLFPLNFFANQFGIFRQVQTALRHVNAELNF